MVDINLNLEILTCASHPFTKRKDLHFRPSTLRLKRLKWRQNSNVWRVSKKFKQMRIICQCGVVDRFQSIRYLSFQNPTSRSGLMICESVNANSGKLYKSDL